MIILVFAIPVFAFYLFLVRRLNRDIVDDTTVPPANIEASTPVLDDLIGTVGSPPLRWTALDDQQLNRLLRESSP